MTFRKFCAVFTSIAFIALFISGVVLVSDYYNKIIVKDNTHSEPVPTSNPGYFNDDTKPFNVLIMSSEKDKGNTDLMMIANIDPLAKRINLLSIPANMKSQIDSNEKVKKINTIYKNHDTDYIIDLFTVTYGINIRYYFYADYATIGSLIEGLGNVEFNLPAELVNYADKINLSAGTQPFNKEKTVQFLKFKEPDNNVYSKDLISVYDGTGYSRAVLSQSFFAEVFKQKLNVESLNVFGQLLKDNSAKIQTNIDDSVIENLINNIKDVESSVEIGSFIFGGSDQNYGLYYYMYNGNIKNLNDDSEIKMSDAVGSHFVSSSAAAISE